MKIVEVSPITAFNFKENFTYFSQSDYKKFDIVKVNLNNKTVFAVVTNVREAEESRIDLKKSEFSIKKIGETKVYKKLHLDFLSSIFRLSKYFACREGFALNEFTPAFLFDDDDELDEANFSFESNINNLVNEKFCLQGSFLERVNFYKSYIRESFARRESVMIVVPHYFLTKKIADMVSNGIENFVFVLNSEISKKKQEKIWRTIIDFNQPCVLICTSNFVGIPKNDFKNIIIENENRSFKKINRPYLSTKKLIEFLANITNSKLFYADNILSLPVQMEINAGNINLTRVFERRIRKNTKRVLDAIASNKDSLGASELLGDAARLILKEIPEAGDRTLIFSSRKGLSPITICRDCGDVLRCEKCNSALTLKKKEGKNIFYCQKCLQAYKSETFCQNCGSYKLYAYGAGIEKLEDELRKNFPYLNIYKIDKDSVKTPKEAFLIYENFIEDKNGLLLATAMASPYVDSRIDNVIIASLDSVLSVPDFSIYERVFKEMVDLYEKANKNFIIQTKDPENQFLAEILSGELKKFTDEELKTRETLGFPPYKTFIKIGIVSTQSSIDQETDILMKLLVEYNPEIVSGNQNNTKRTVLIRLDKKIWPNEHLSGILNSLPAQYIVDIDPERII